jgi:plasmid replication initiation protein
MAKLITQSFAKIPNEYVSIERSRSLSLLEEKLVYMLINAMQKRWESIKKLDKIDYDFIANGLISFDDYRNTMQIKSKDNKEIIETLKDLYNFTLLIDDNNVLKFMHFFAHFDVDKTNHLIQYKFSERFIQYFTGICRDYFMLSVDEVIGLNSTHAIRIYQLLKTKQNMDKKEFVYALDEIKKQLNIDKKYTLYGDFRRYVLELTKSQINASEASQFNIDYEEIKTGKAVTSIKFHILPKGKNYYQENNLIAGYKIDQITKYCNKWKKEYNQNDVVYILADKILNEHKAKKPSRVAIASWLDTITLITKQQKLI